jgi:hypothetical protein
VKSLNREDSLTAVTGRLLRFRLTLVGVEEISGKRDKVMAEDYKIVIGRNVVRRIVGVLVEGPKERDHS